MYILLSHKKERNWVICRAMGMNLETVIQSEVSQKEKNKYRMLTYIYMESKKQKQKNGHEEPRGKTGIKTQTY